ncbi:hypothetical protein FOMPIDRAFT_1049999 [Fomitopsis schrenkii]|uniref:Uncharacterized protein n=1 Tax=Fomitopsis schrenkii TaxID=2126942 RepID=S8E680_FOMSC|nr:hypothetical protein FOMPIDRAFT_1049999 [Fomitopsis schrenkii]
MSSAASTSATFVIPSVFTWSTNQECDLEAQTLTAPPAALTTSPRTRPSHSNTINDFFGAPSARGTQDSRNDELSLPVHRNDDYADAEHPTLAMYLFKFGFQNVHATPSNTNPAELGTIIVKPHRVVSARYSCAIGLRAVLCLVVVSPWENPQADHHLPSLFAAAGKWFFAESTCATSSSPHTAPRTRRVVSYDAATARTISAQGHRSASITSAVASSQTAAYTSGAVSYYDLITDLSRAEARAVARTRDAARSARTMPGQGTAASISALTAPSRSNSLSKRRSSALTPAPSGSPTSHATSLPFLVSFSEEPEGLLSTLITTPSPRKSPPSRAASSH